MAAAETIGFHLGTDSVSIDLGTGSLGEAAITEAEALANQVVAGNAQVRAWFPEAAELRALALRKPPEVAGPVRVVAIGDFDLSACGGTHVATAGEVGLIAVQGVERLKRGTRIEFLCGRRARADYRRKHVILQELSATLTCAPSDLVDSVDRLQLALRDARSRLSRYRERELDEEAAGLLYGAATRGSVRVVQAACEGRPVEEIRALVLRLTTNPGVVVMLGIAGDRAQLVFGRSEAVTVELEPVFRGALAALGGGRGGGTRILQGAAGPADQATVERVLGEAEAALPSPGVAG